MVGATNGGGGDSGTTGWAVDKEAVGEADDGNDEASLLLHPIVVAGAVVVDGDVVVALTTRRRPLVRTGA